MVDCQMIFLTLLLLINFNIYPDNLAFQAVRSSDHFLLKISILCGANINKYHLNDDLKGYSTHDSLLHFAVKNNDLKTVKILIKNGANTNAINRQNRWTIIDYVFKYNAFAIFKYMLKNGLRDNQPDHMSGLPRCLLFKAMTFDRPRFFKILLKGKTNISAVVGGGSDLNLTPLAFSVDSNRIWAAKLLLEKGANINTLFRAKGILYGPINVLMFAVALNRVEFVKLFLKYKPNIQFKGGGGDVVTKNFTIMEYAKFLGRKKIVDLLKNAGAK